MRTPISNTLAELDLQEIDVGGTIETMGDAQRDVNHMCCSGFWFGAGEEVEVCGDCGKG